ncbi:hypothetical protein F5984_25675 [Rudanella paleaurantiibacter]|uniref:Peptidase C39 domain-containing protein n=1 Tax=Rudanella paleaurantiibacter TaxID=2614655 RepID=A0A7J5TRV0_9BACT|nr:vitamin K epoxide reductase family protein [Rudanella paleaurantiibacter]KAB7725713.1 hypothetical protein F5984_25675 [Rudanella paleaurantiibacter]
MILSKYEISALGAVNRLLDLKNVRITGLHLKNKLLQEPTFPSLLSLSNVLTDFTIFNAPLIINPKQLGKIPIPAVAHLENGMGYVVINKVDVENNLIEWHHEQAGACRETISEFCQKWQGAIMVVKPDEKAGEDYYETSRITEKSNKLRLPFIYASLAFLIGYFVVYISTNVLSIQSELFRSILSIKIIGVILCAILTRLSINALDGNSKITDVKSKLQNSLNLSTRKILGFLNWSEIGLIYFVFGLSTLLLLDTENHSNIYAFLKWLNFTTVLYVLWAIYYQRFVIRKPCLLCIASVVLLLGEFYLLFAAPLLIEKNNHFPYNHLLTNFLLILTLWVFIRKYLFNSMSNESTYYALQKLKFSIDYVQTIFSKSSTTPPIFDKMQFVEVGNPDAANTLLVVLNPSSALGAIRFKELISLSASTQQISSKIILVPDSPNDFIGINIIKNILGYPTNQRLAALTAWFEWTDFNKCGFSVQVEENDVLTDVVEEHIDWANLARIPFTTPSIFLEDTLLPAIYAIKEIPKLFYLRRFIVE